MFRSSFLIVFVCSMIATATSASEFEVTSDVVGAEVVVSGEAGSFASAAPLRLSALPPGRYDVELFAHGRSLGHRSVDVATEARLLGSQRTRWMLSTFAPGLGQLRDEGWREAWTPAAAALLPMARIFHFVRETGEQEERAESLAAVSSTDPQLHLARETALAEAYFAHESQEDYLRLFLYMHIGNILNASVRRGSIEFSRTSSRSVQALHRPVGTTRAVLLSAGWPGLGQLRAGHRTRAKVWHLGVLGLGTALVEAQRAMDEATRDRRILEQTQLAGTPEYERRASDIAGSLGDARRLRNTVAAIGAAFWVANLFDAAFSAGAPPLETDVSLSRSTEPVGGWRVEPGMFDGGTGLVVSRSF